MENRFFFLYLALMLVLTGCEGLKPDTDDHSTPKLDDAAYLCGGLVKEVDGVPVPIRGTLQDNSLFIPVTSFYDAENHFRSLLPPDAHLQDIETSLIWNMTDEEGVPQGDAVFSIASDEVAWARVTLPDTFPASFRSIFYLHPLSQGSIDPNVQEDLEDNYFYGAIVDIADHGYGSGKFVVLREYNFESGAPGLAVRLENKLWDTEELKLRDNSHRVYGRASSLSTLRTAGAIIRNDMTVLSKQLNNAGCYSLGGHFASSDKTWNGWHYYYCLHNDECDWIGPINDTAFYECWLYWFAPDGNRIRFW